MFELFLLMGGLMSVKDEAEYPWFGLETSAL